MLTCAELPLRELVTTDAEVEIEMAMQRVRALAIAATLLAVAACGSNTAGSAGAQTVRLGYQKTTWGAPLILAEQTNAWNGTGTSVKSITLSSGSDVRDGMLAGSLDAGSLGSAPFVVGASKGGIVAVAVIGYAGRTEAVVVPPDSSVKSVADLKGKKIGSQSGSVTNEVFVSKVAGGAGLSPNDYRLVELKFQDMYSAMVSGQVDAFAGVDPYPQLAVYKHTGRVLTTYENYDVVPLYLCVTKDMAQKHPNQVVSLLEGLLRTTKKWKDDPKGTAQTVSKVFAASGTDLPEPVMQASLADLDVTPDFAPDTEKYLTAQANSMMKQGQIDKMPDWSKAIDTSFLEKAKAKVGGAS